MRRHQGWLALLALCALCAGGAWLVLRTTAEYPALGEPVSYPVDQTEGFQLTIEEILWTPFRGYTIEWAVTAASDEVYTFSKDGEEETLASST